MPPTRSLNDYRLLGNSGLRISPLALGTMTFGTEWKWGSNEGDARAIYDLYVERGGNFIDTANRYTDGTSEKLIGKFMHGRRDRMVVATKFAFPTSDDPNSGGNHRKCMVTSAETSLRRLNTDYIDLLYLHAWDDTTPVDEVLRAMDDLVRSGKVLYIGICNTPAWQISRMQVLAQLLGWSRFIALEIEYNLLQRSAERELIPMAREMGLGIVPWSPLRGGVLSGKYNRASRNDSIENGSRSAFVEADGLITDRSLALTERLSNVAKELGKRPSQVAIAWLLTRPGVAAPIVGARTIDQFTENLGALDVEMTSQQLAMLDELSAIDMGYPHDYLERMKRRPNSPLGVQRGRINAS